VVKRKEAGNNQKNKNLPYNLAEYLHPPPNNNIIKVKFHSLNLYPLSNVSLKDFLKGL